MEYIGKRISIKRTESELSIVILSLINKLKSRFLFLWFILWSISGIIVLSQYFIMHDPNTKTAIIVWMGFWAYFEYKIFHAYLWRKSGKEKIKINDKKLLYKRDVSGRGKIKTYEIDFIKDLRLIEPKENSFMEDLNNSYWVIGGEKLTFDYYGKEIKFGLQLDEADAKALLKLIMKEIKR
ncbi:MAG: hypothetical protein K8R85_11875 [Bacteroidetes bacterium]|nr:hypothetical protein [Bacteroidota bacterium]